MTAGVPTAIAKPVKPALRISPAAPTLKTPITVAWRRDPAAPATTRYGVTLTIRPGATEKLTCSYGSSWMQRRAARGAVLTATLKPTGDPEETRKWCPGPATITLRRLPARSGPPQVLAMRRVTIRRGPGELDPGPVDTPASIRLLAGSTITLSTAGRPDRTSPVNGVLRGFIPSPFRLGQDVSITRTGGSLVPVGLPADPLCPGTSPPTSLQVTRASTMTVFQGGRVTLTMTLNGSASQLIGCGPPGSLTGTTTIALTGRTGPRGLLALSLDGSAGGITLNLLVVVDLSDRR